MELRVYADAEALAVAAAELFRDRVVAKPTLVMAVPAGRTPRRMYALIASHEPTADFTTSTCPVDLLSSTVDYILTDEVIQGDVCSRAVSLGVQTILAAREVIVLVSGVSKRAALRAMLHGPETPDV